MLMITWITLDYIWARQVGQCAPSNKVIFSSEEIFWCLNLNVKIKYYLITAGTLSIELCHYCLDLVKSTTNECLERLTESHLEPDFYFGYYRFFLLLC